MTDSNDNDRKADGARTGGGTLTLKRPVVEQSRVKQSFAHGRTKTVVVETKRKRIGDDKPASQKPSPRPFSRSRRWRRERRSRHRSSARRRHLEVPAVPASSCAR